MTQYFRLNTPPSPWHRAADVAGQVWEQHQEQKRQEELQRQQEEERERQRKDAVAKTYLQMLEGPEQVRALQEYDRTGGLNIGGYQLPEQQVDPEAQYKNAIYSYLYQNWDRLSPVQRQQALAKFGSGSQLSDFALGLSMTDDPSKRTEAVDVGLKLSPDANTEMTQGGLNQRQQNQFAHDKSMEQKRQENRVALEQIKSTMTPADSKVLTAQMAAINDRIEAAKADIKRFQELEDIEKVNAAKRAYAALLDKQDAIIKAYGGGSITAPTGASNPNDPLGLD